MTHEKIIEIIKNKGPSLPINIAKELSMSSLFVSAFLSELIGEKRLKLSSLRVGGTPLYYIEGQENLLENFYKYLASKEIESYLLLKKYRVLKDSDQEPAIRVALRSIRDFAVGFKKDDDIYWRFYSVNRSELEEYFGMNVKKSEKKSVKKEKIQVKKENVKKIESKVESNDKDNSFENPLVIKSEEKAKKQKQKSEFCQNVEKILKRKFKIIEEIDFKANEINLIIEINSDLGEMRFFVRAKDKKNITEADVKKLLSDSQKMPLPALLMYSDKLSKKAVELSENYSSILKLMKI